MKSLGYYFHWFNSLSYLMKIWIDICIHTVQSSQTRHSWTTVNWSSNHTTVLKTQNTCEQKQKRTLFKFIDNRLTIASLAANPLQNNVHERHLKWREFNRSMLNCSWNWKPDSNYIWCFPLGFFLQKSGNYDQKFKFEPLKVLR